MRECPRCQTLNLDSNPSCAVCSHTLGDQPKLNPTIQNALLLRPESSQSLDHQQPARLAMRLYGGPERVILVSTILGLVLGIVLVFWRLQNFFDEDLVAMAAGKSAVVDAQLDSGRQGIISRNDVAEPIETVSLEPLRTSAGSQYESFPPLGGTEGTEANDASPSVLVEGEIVQATPEEPSDGTLGEEVGQRDDVSGEEDERQKIENAISQLELLSQEVVESYGGEGEEDELMGQLEAFRDASVQTRKAFQRAYKKGLERTSGSPRSSVSMSEEAARKDLQSKAWNLIHQGSEIENLVRLHSPSREIQEHWSKIQENLRILSTARL